jgi:hypothetical protein
MGIIYSVRKLHRFFRMIKYQSIRPFDNKVQHLVSNLFYSSVRSYSVANFHNQLEEADVSNEDREVTVLSWGGGGGSFSKM